MATNNPIWIIIDFIYSTSPSIAQKTKYIIKELKIGITFDRFQ